MNAPKLSRNNHRIFFTLLALVVALGVAAYPISSQSAEALGPDEGATGRSQLTVDHQPASTTASATFVSTFESIGVYWSVAEGSPSNTCLVRYRLLGSEAFKNALPLWFDSRNGEYRGSIVNLDPGQVYEIELTLASTSTTIVGTASTWNEEFPVAKVIELPPMSGETLRITESGTPAGYVLYTAPEGATATIDVDNRRDHNVEVNASYVIIRGLTLRGAAVHGIRIYPPSHDVVIERCDISGWGRIASNGWGVDRDSAIYAYESGELNPTDTTVNRIIIQRNKLHHPRSDSNSWVENGHPHGPQAVTFLSAGTNHVIRYNAIYSDDEHYFNDGLSGWQNFSYAGFPHADSDIYGNRISHCWDDGIEAEGGNRNVRIWGNYIDKTLGKIAIASTSVGPLYIWRNVANVAQKDSAVITTGEGDFIKVGGQDQYLGGRIYVFHNTLLQPPGPAASLGCSGGIIDSGGVMTELHSRNNILHIVSSSRDSIDDDGSSSSNDFDYDLYNGAINPSHLGHEAHGIRAVPVYDPNNGEGEFALHPSSPGYDDGVVLANFNDDHTGSGPDMGAHEAGTPPMEFGVDAYLRLVAKISSPVDGAIFDVGESIIFKGSATDAEDGDVTDSLTWVSSLDGVIGTGGAFTRANLSAGVHTITATATDRGGLTGWDQITITVNPANSPPAAKISSPADGAVFQAREAVTFTGSSSDTEDGSLTDSLLWVSSLNGVIGTGGAFIRANLSAGVHTITATATDSGGLSGWDQITITVNPANTPPAATIVNPADGAVFEVGTEVTFIGSGSDSEDGSVTDSLSWVSSLDGVIGTGGAFTRANLSAGVHTITATATDRGGLTGWDQITITVNPANSPPAAKISSPADGAVFQAREAVTFTGSATDTEDGDVTGSLSWVSSLDGTIGLGGSFSRDNLSVGTHTITATVTDSGGAVGSDEITITVNPANTPPVATISSPAHGAVFEAGEAVTFIGSATDAEDGDVTIGLTWVSSFDGSIGTGGSLSRSDLSVGTHTITALVIDSGGAVGSDEITITISPANTPPVVTISSPDDGAVLKAREVITFTGSATDAEDGDVTASLSWVSSLDGEIGSGGSFTGSDLSVGLHAIVATATDSGGLTGSGQIFISFNRPLTATISSPAEGASFEEGESVTFSGAASDAEIGDVTDSLSWVSSLDGELGTGGSFTRSDLSVGMHTITATANYTGGLSSPDQNSVMAVAAGHGDVNGSDQITITVRPANRPPVVTVSTPSEGAVFVAGEMIAFTGSATDAVDGDLTDTLTWVSSLDGVIGTGRAFTRSNLSTGVHTITVTAIDSEKLIGSEKITLTVALSFRPSDDAMVSKRKPTDNYGSESYLELRDFRKDTILSYLKFAITGVRGAVKSAKLRLYANRDCDFGGSVFKASNQYLDDPSTQWTEDGLTWENAPDFKGMPLSTAGAVAAGSWVELDVTAAMEGDGVYSFGMDISWVELDRVYNFDNARNRASYHSKEALENQPVLVVEVNTPPTAVIDSPVDEILSGAAEVLESGAVFETGTAITFTGSASDPEDGDLTDSLLWVSNLDGVLGMGGSFTRSDLSVGMHTITATVADSQGLSGSDEITITVDSRPTAVISSPVLGMLFEAGVAIAFEGSGSDPEDGDVTASMTWVSSLDGELGTGGSFTRSDLSVGMHTVTAVVTDSVGLSGSDQITITIDSRPTATINTPADGILLEVGTAITFNGSASDSEDGDVTAGMTWVSSLDGELGTGGSITKSDLSVGMHTITAVVTDSVGLSGSDEITLTVDSPPTATISTPAAAGLFEAGTAIAFEGSGSDPEDGDVTASLIWVSSLDGEIGTGGSITRSDLSVGMHTITATVTDSVGLSGSDEITITINSPPAETVRSAAKGDPHR